QAEDGIRDRNVTGVQTCALPISLKPWDERKAMADDIVKFVGARGSAVSEGLVFAFNPVPIRGLGTAGGMEMFLQSRANADAKKRSEERRVGKECRDEG